MVANSSYKVQHEAGFVVGSNGNVHVFCNGFKPFTVYVSHWNCRTGEHPATIEKAELTFFGPQSGYFELEVRTAPFAKCDGAGKPHMVASKLITKGGTLLPLEHTCEEPFYGVWRAE